MINIAEILKDCPKGMELYSPIFGEGTLHKVTDRIHVNFQTEHNNKCFDVWGKYSKGVECMLFPTEDDRDWSGFQRPFKDGDILIDKSGFRICIYKGRMPYCHNHADYYCGYDGSEFVVKKYCDNFFGCVSDKHLATDEEIKKFMSIIRENGYKWNAETKTLEKLKKEKFDISTLKPFDKVLVRLDNANQWYATWFSHIDGIHTCYCRDYVTAAGKSYTQMIPYKGNEHLLGTTDDCDEFYKTWE